MGEVVADEVDLACPVGICPTRKRVIAAARRAKGAGVLSQLSMLTKDSSGGILGQRHSSQTRCRVRWRCCRAAPGKSQPVPSNSRSSLVYSRGFGPRLLRSARSTEVQFLNGASISSPSQRPSSSPLASCAPNSDLIEAMTLRQFGQRMTCAPVVEGGAGQKRPAGPWSTDSSVCIPSRRALRRVVALRLNARLTQPDSSSRSPSRQLARAGAPGGRGDPVCVQT